jgi:ATP-dependent DNA helicase
MAGRTNDDEDGDWDPAADADEIITDEMRAAEADALKQNDTKEEKRTQQLLKTMDSKKERKRIDSLHSLLDKTAVYSQFVSSQIKAVDANIQGQIQGTGDKAGKRKASDNQNGRGKKTKDGKGDPKFVGVKESSKEARPEGQPTLITGGSMRDYQLQGTAWLISLYENGMNGILADEMGLGKTVQTIAMMAYLFEKGVAGTFLVVAPLSTVTNWYREVHFWTKEAMKAQIYHGTAAERTELRKEWGSQEKVNVVITSFEIAMRDVAHFQKGTSKGNKTWKYLAVDEGHRLKNKDCRLIRELKTIPSDNRLLLTGTPLQNDLNELWSLLNFLLPNIFDNLASFQSWFDFDAGALDHDKILQEESQNAIVGKLHSILKPFLLRRQKMDVDLEIPRKKEIILYCSNTSEQQWMYKNLIKYASIIPPEKVEEGPMGKGHRFKKDVCYDEDLVTEHQFSKALDNEDDLGELESAKKTKKHGGRRGSGTPQALAPTQTKAKTSLKNRLMQMRKICNHPFLFEEVDTEYDTTETIIEMSGKMKLLDRLLSKLHAGGHKVLIFSQMTKLLTILEDFLHFREIKYCRIDGGVGMLERQAQMDLFNNDPEYSVFLLSTRAGGLGINLVAADTVIIYDSDWNPQADLQAQDRCHRIGQKKPVLVYRLCASGTVEEKILERAANKRRLEKMVVSNGKFVNAGAVQKADQVEALNAEELLQLLQDRYADEKKDMLDMTDKQIDEVMDRTALFRDGDKAAGKKGAAKEKAKTGVGYDICEEVEDGGFLSGLA